MFGLSGEIADGITMPSAMTDDGIRLHYEESGRGTPLIFVHEFAGDHRSYEAQLRHFGRRYHAIAFNARGYPPSDVPEAESAYSQARAADDILAILDHIGAPRAHVAGISMGAFATLHFGLRHHDRALSLCLGGCGYGAEPERQALFRAEADATAEILRRDGMAAFAERYAYGPTRVQFENKDPRGHAEFKRMLAEHSAVGSANTQAGVQKGRPSLYDLTDALARITAPTLIVAGDEDWPCLTPSLMLKRVIPSAGLAVLPNTGHALSVEEPDAYNRLLDDFLAQAESGRWPMRDPRATSATITGIKG
jgi:pimeloyl-ACP methyl ester carboxylesterase